MRGRKRHTLVDTEGFVVKIQLTRLFRGKRAASIKKIWADMGYQGQKLRKVAKMHNKDLEVVKRLCSKVWVIQEQIAL